MKEEIVSFIEKVIDKNNYDGAVIGISGGLDSAVTAKLTVEALGKETVLGVIMSERDSARQTKGDAEHVCDYLGIERIVKPIRKALKALNVYKMQPSTLFVPRSVEERYVKKRIESSKGDVFIKDLKNEGDEDFLKGLAYYRVKHRIRMACLYLEAEKRNYAVIGTTNRTEYMTGFYVKWGDDSSDIEPVLHLYKTQIFELAERLDIPEKIQNKAPSPDLIPGITDEEMLGINYSELDDVLLAMEKGQELEKFEPANVARVKEILKAAEKRNIKNISMIP